MPILRAAWLSAQNEARLLTRDPVILLMLLLAPVVIITVAGYSLGTIYGSTGVRPVPVVDRDGGDVATAVVRALRDARVGVALVPDIAEARRLVNRADGPPLAIEIRAGTTTRVRAGRAVDLVLHTDPVKRIEADAMEVRLGELCRQIADEVRAGAERKLRTAERRLRRGLGDVGRTVAAERTRVRDALERGRVSAADEVRRQVAVALARARHELQRLVRAREEEAWAGIAAQLDERRAVLERLRSQLDDLVASERAFADWLARLRELAGTHAAALPPPPPFPTLPSVADLTALEAPIARPPTARLPPDGLLVHDVSVSLPPIALEETSLDPLRLVDDRFGPLPGSLGLVERAASPGARLDVNAFDQYVPGFGITFLLIGMMMGVALTLFDERDWGTLHRLCAGGVPLSGILLGKVAARFVVGVSQMLLLFAVGRCLFGISLGPRPSALLLPTVGISFAAAALGLVIPSVARSHDSVMPLGTMTSMAMSAIGGCWWPIGFEPPWMQALARGLPTTWAMRAYNDLMIRRTGPLAVIQPFAATIALGLLFLALGLYRHLRRDL